MRQLSKHLPEPNTNLIYFKKVKAKVRQISKHLPWPNITLRGVDSGGGDGGCIPLDLRWGVAPWSVAAARIVAGDNPCKILQNLTPRIVASCMDCRRRQYMTQVLSLIFDLTGDNICKQNKILKPRIVATCTYCRQFHVYKCMYV